MPSNPEYSLAIESPKIFPIDSKPFGLSYGEWSAKWWQWVYSLPDRDNPFKDLTGEKCTLNQSGPVWFLAGTGRGSAERTCIIPEGKALLFPILNGSCDVVTNPSLKTESELAKCASPYKHVSLEASVDGIKIDNLDKFKAFSPLYNFSMPEGNDLGLPPGSPNKAVSFGYWIILEPLSPGNHEIHFRGADNDFTITAPSTVFTEATYHLIVK